MRRRQGNDVARTIKISPQRGGILLFGPAASRFPIDELQFADHFGMSCAERNRTVPYCDGCKAMIAIPASASTAPATSKRLSATPSTNRSHNRATQMYAPP